MGQAIGTATPFKSWLRGELDARGWGVRTLAKRMDPAKPEVPRRALNRYLKGSLPSDANRVAIARGLGIEVADVPSSERSSDDDEESDPAMHEAFSLFVDLMDRINARKAAEVEA